MTESQHACRACPAATSITIFRLASSVLHLFYPQDSETCLSTPIGHMNRNIVKIFLNDWLSDFILIRVSNADHNVEVYVDWIRSHSRARQSTAIIVEGKLNFSEEVEREEKGKLKLLLHACICDNDLHGAVTLSCWLYMTLGMVLNRFTTKRPSLLLETINQLSGNAFRKTFKAMARERSSTWIKSRGICHSRKNEAPGGLLEKPIKKKGDREFDKMRKFDASDQRKMALEAVDGHTGNRAHWKIQRCSCKQGSKSHGLVIKAKTLKKESTKSVNR